MVVRSAAFAQAVAARTHRALATGPPSVFECRIERDDAGRAVYDAVGRPVVAVDRRDRPCTEEASSTVSSLVARGVAQLPGLPPLF